MENNNTVPMLSPDGEIGDVPHDKVSDAVKAGFQVGQDMLSPDGQAGTIPLDKVHDALGAGFQMSGAAPKAPNVDMQEEGSNLQHALNPTQSVAHPGEGNFAAEHPEENKKVLLPAAAIGAGGTAAVEAGALPLAGAVKNKVLKHLAEQTPNLFGHEAVKETLKRYALQGLQNSLKGAGWGLGAEGLHEIWNGVFDKRNK